MVTNKISCYYQSKRIMLQFKSVSGIRLLDRLRSQIFLKIYHNYQKSMQYEE